MISGLRLLLWSTLVWLGTGAAFAAQSFFEKPRDVALLAWMVRQTLVYWSPHILDTLVLFAAVRAFRLERGKLVKHGLILFGIANAMLFVHLVQEVLWARALIPVAELVKNEWPTEFVPLYRYLLAHVILWVNFDNAAIVAVAHALESNRRLRERETETEALRRGLVEAELHSLRMQLQPHFLFNTLHAIGVTARRDPENASRMITLLGDLLRLSLQGSSAQLVPLAKELEFLAPYLEIQRMRFSDRLAVDVDAPRETLPVLVPSLMLQPLVENAIRHGIESRAGQGKVSIRARLEAGTLEVRVIDDGEGLPNGKPEREGVGLGNTRARLEKLFGERHELRIEPSASGGAQVAIRFPASTTNHGA